MRGSFRIFDIAIAVAMVCAVHGCASRAPTTANKTLTPYSTLYAAQTSSPNAPVAQAAPTDGQPTPFRYSPTDVDPDLLHNDKKKSFGDRLAEMTPKKMMTASKTAVGLGPDEDLAKQLYTEADLAFREKRYREAAKKYKQAASRWPDSILEEDAMFMLGESQFQQDMYPKASDTYTNLLKKYENSRHLDMIVKRRFEIGRYWERQGLNRPMLAFNFTNRTMPFWDTTGNTIAVYESIRMDDPTGPLADDATMATANTYFVKEEWEDAAYHYNLVRKEFPQSEFQPQAHLLALQSTLRAYQGPHYDSKPLDDAKELANVLQTQYAQQMPKERQNIQEAQRHIESELAKRDYSLGEYYYNTKHFAAAKYYYNEVVARHPQTQYAQLARARADEIKESPDAPKDEVQWLASKLRLGGSSSGQQPPPTAPVPAQEQPIMANQPQVRR